MRLPLTKHRKSCKPTGVAALVALLWLGALVAISRCSGPVLATEGVESQAVAVSASSAAGDVNFEELDYEIDEVVEEGLVPGEGAYLGPDQPPVSGYPQPAPSNYTNPGGPLIPLLPPYPSGGGPPGPMPLLAPPPPQGPYVPIVSPPGGYNRPGNYSSGFQYPPADLLYLIPVFGYRSNYPQQAWYNNKPYRKCVTGGYLAVPTVRDIELAFNFAQQQLQSIRGASVQFWNNSQLSWTARHQVFSFLTQQNARMDEEGLLVEIVSGYLADRACLTIWDKQRYLPSLTRAISTTNFPPTHSCYNYQRNLQWQGQAIQGVLRSRFRPIDGFGNNPYRPYWGKSNVCHIRLMSPDYADGISVPRQSYNPKFPLPNPRFVSNIIHHEVPIDGPYNLFKMQWGQFINHDITNTALSSYEGLVDCCKNPTVRGCWPIYVPPGDPFYSKFNVTCLNFIRSGVCPLCQLGPRQQINKNTAFLDASQVYGQTLETSRTLRLFQGGLLRFSKGKTGEILLPTTEQEQCSGVCFLSGDTRTNQHPALVVMHTLMLRNHNYHASQLQRVHPNWNDELLFQEARRLNIAEYQMITYAEYMPIVFGPLLSAYYKLLPLANGYTYYEPHTDPTTWNEYATATCRFGHSQIQSIFGLYPRVLNYGLTDPALPSFRLKEWFLRPSLVNDGLLPQITNGLLSEPSFAVDPWLTDDVRNHLYASHKEPTGGDLAATNIWRGRDHGIPGYVYYLEYCFNYKARNWRDLALFIPPIPLNNLRKVYKVVENIDLFTGGLSERHFPGADIGPTFGCVNGLQYYHLKFGDRYYFEHGNQAGSFTLVQLAEIKRTNLARLICRTANIPAVPQYAFLAPSQYNPLVNCSATPQINYSLF